MSGKLVRSGAFVFLGVLLGRIAGLARELLVGTQYGSSSAADIIVLLISIPDVLLSILVGGALGAALIPELQSQTPERAWLLYRKSLWMVGLAALPVWTVLSLFSGGIVALMAPEMKSGAAQEAARNLPWMMLTIPLTCMAAVERAYLQSRDDFQVSSFSTVLYNLALVAGLVVLAGRTTWAWLSVAAIAGAFLGWAMQTWRAQRYRPQGVQDDPAVRISQALWVRYGQALMAGAVLLLIAPAARALASKYGEGNQALFYYGVKLVDLPLGTVLTVFAVVLFPLLARTFASPDDFEQGVRTARSGLTVVAVTAVGIAVAVSFFAPEFARVVFGYGKLAGQTGPIGSVCAVATVAMFCQATYSILIATLDARKDTLTPFLCSLVGMGGLFGYAALLEPRLGFAGLGLAYGLAHATVLILLLIAASRKHRIDLFPSLVGPTALWTMAVCAGLTYGLCLAIALVVENPYARVLGSILAGGAAIGAGLASHPQTRRFMNPKNLKRA